MLGYSCFSSSCLSFVSEEETLSPEALGGIITVAIVGVTGIGVLIGIVSFLILKSSTSGKSNKYAIDSMETIDTHTTEI
jgi:hypothetical protein